MARTHLVVFLAGSLFISVSASADKVPALLETVWSDNNPSYLDPIPGQISRFYHYGDLKPGSSPGTAIETILKILGISEAEIRLSYSWGNQQVTDRGNPGDFASTPWVEISVTSRPSVLHFETGAPEFPPLELRLVPREPPEWNPVSIQSLVPTIDVQEVVSQDRGSVSVRLFNRNELPVIGVEFGEQLPSEVEFHNYFYTQAQPGGTFADPRSAWNQTVPVSRRYNRIGSSVQLDTNIQSIRVLTCAKLSDGSVVGNCVSYN